MSDLGKYLEDTYDRALAFAAKAHDGQVRKYTGAPYIGHPIEVAQILSTAPGIIGEQVIAGLLHDVIEDTDIGVVEIEQKFGCVVAVFVEGMTDTTVPSDGNRATRKAMDRARLARTSPEVKTIKLADMISNSRDILEHDPGFAKTYIPEMDLLLGVLTEGNSTLYAIARKQIREAKEQLNADE